MATTRKPHSLLDINLIFTDFEKTNRPLTVEENTCTVCFENYNYGNNLIFLVAIVSIFHGFVEI